MTAYNLMRQRITLVQILGKKHNFVSDKMINIRYNLFMAFEDKIKSIRFKLFIVIFAFSLHQEMTFIYFVSKLIKINFFVKKTEILQ